MSEENSNNVQQPADSGQETAQLAQEGAKLAKSIASKDVKGGVESAVKLLKNKKTLKTVLIAILVPALIIILIASCVFAVFYYIGDFLITLGNTIVNAIVDFFTIDDPGAIDITDEQIDVIINGLTAMGVDIEELRLMGDGVDYSDPDVEAKTKEKLREYIRHFYEAQAITQTINTKPNWLQDWASGDKPHGNVYVYRVKDSGKNDVEAEIKDSEKIQLEYEEYTKMEEMRDKKDENILKKFSIDSEGKLVYASMYEKVVNGTSQKEIQLHSENYMDVISQYTTSMNFYIYLTMISQNPEFASKVADLAKLAKIDIMLLDEKITSTTVTEETYTENKQKCKNIGTKDEPHYVRDEEAEITEKESKPIKTTTTVTSIKPKFVVTYVKTWFCEQNITYNRVPKTIGPNIQTEQVAEDEIPPEEPIEDEKYVTWKTNQKQTTTTTQTYVTYEEGIHGDVIDKTGEKGSQGVNGFGNVDENTTFIGLMDDEFKIPNTNQHEVPSASLISGADMFCTLLQQNPQTQLTEKWMRYIFNKYENTDKYGDVTWQDLADLSEIRQVTVGTEYNVYTLMSEEKLKINDAEILKSAIEKIYTGNIKNNLTKEINNFMDMQLKYNVNAVFAVAVAYQETKAGTEWGNISNTTYNWYAIPTDPNNYLNSSRKSYTSYKEATMDFGKWISDYYFKSGRYTVENIAPSKGWERDVTSIMNEIYKAAGIEVDINGFISGGVKNDEEKVELQDYIETNLIYTTENSGVLNKSGSIAKWWGSGNPLERFQCTWWVYGRGWMYLEQNGNESLKNQIPICNAKDFYNNAKANGVLTCNNTVPRANSIICFERRTIWTCGLCRRNK